MEEANDYESSYDYGGMSHTIIVCNRTFHIEPDDFILQDIGSRVILGLLVLLIFLIGIIGNLFVVVAVVLSKRLQTITNVFVINLAVSDFLTAAFLPVHASTLLTQSNCYIPEFLCQFVAASSLTTLGCSIITLAMIAFQRFTVLYSVMKPEPTFDNTFRKRTIIGMISFAWLYPIILMSIILPLKVGSLGYVLQYRICGQNTEGGNSDYLTLTVCLLVQFPAFLIIIVCYVNIFKMFRRHQKEMYVGMAPSIMISTTRDEVNITIVEELPEDKTREVDNGAVNLGFTDCDGVEHVAPCGMPTGNSNSADLQNNKSNENGDQYNASQEEKESHQQKSSSGSTISSVQTISRDTLTREHNARFKQQCKITINLFIFVCVYTICVMPSAIVYPIPRSGPGIPWLTILLLCNVCVNPIIYALRHPTFSEVLMSMLKCSYRNIPEPSTFLRRRLYAIDK